MSDNTEPDSIILRYLRQIDSKVDRLSEDMRDVKHRLTTLEESHASLVQAFAGQSKRLDRVENRLDRIERRLDLVDVHSG